MPQQSYEFPTIIARAGLPGSRRAAELARVASCLTPVLYAERTVTVGGTASDGVYSFTVDGVLVEFERADAEDHAGIAAGLAAAGDGVPSLQGRFAFSSDAAVVTVRSKVHTEDFTIAVVNEPGTGTLTAAQVVDPADAVSIPLGLGLVRAGAPVQGAQPVALPTDSATAATFFGISRLNEAALTENTGERGVEDSYGPGSVFGVQENEDIWVQVDDAVAAGGAVFWITDGSGTIGGFRSDADGGNAIALTYLQFRTSTTGPGLAKVQFIRS
jgi:hypothetical protein